MDKICVCVRACVCTCVSVYVSVCICVCSMNLHSVRLSVQSSQATLNGNRLVSSLHTEDEALRRDVVKKRFVESSGQNQAVTMSKIEEGVAIN